MLRSNIIKYHCMRMLWGGGGQPLLDSKFEGCEFKTVRFRSLGNFVYPTLPQSTQLQMSTNTVWKVPAMD